MSPNSCLACANKSKSFGFASISLDCVGNAIEVIQSHYVFLQKSSQQQLEEIQLLRTKNHQLTKALALLEQELENGTTENNNECRQNNKRKRPNLNANDNLDNSSQSDELEDLLTDDECIGNSEDCSNLNVALNSEQLLDASSVSSSFICPSPASKASTSGSFLKNRSAQKTKLQMEKSTVDKAAAQFKKPSLSLRKIGTNDVRIKSAGQNSWQSNTVLGDKGGKTVASVVEELDVIQFLSDDDDENEQDKIQQGKDNVSVTSGDESINEFELRPEEHVHIPDSDETLMRDDETASVQILTPATQDIVFLDDTCDKIDENSMDLLQNLMRNENMDKLKRLENEGIKKLQGGSSNIVKIGGNLSSNLKVNKLKSNSISNYFSKNSKTCNNTLQNNSSKSTLQPKIKQESAANNTSKATAAKSSPPTAAKAALNASKAAINIKVKQERLSEACSAGPANEPSFKVPPIKPEKGIIDIQKRYNISCKQCQNYINFMSDNITEQQIVAKLQACRVHNKVSSLDETPDGFWNPLMETLPPEDPRNEVLIDNRLRLRK